MTTIQTLQDYTLVMKAFIKFMEGLGGEDLLDGVEEVVNGGFTKAELDRLVELGIFKPHHAGYWDEWD